MCCWVTCGGGAQHLICTYRDRQCLDHRSCDLILDLEYVVELSVIGLRPEVITVVGADELGGDTQMIACLTNAAFEDVCDGERPGNVRNGGLFAFKVKRDRKSVV